LISSLTGYHDTPIGPTNDIALLEAIVEAQSEILADIWGVEAASDPKVIPQMWCLYKEVQGYIDAGMEIPEHITLLWADDNYGNIRRLPRGNETERSGGAGVYYHFDYVGDPRSYKWINSAKLQKTWEQMHMAYERNAREIWIVNVGDLKPLELPISHMMDLAYDITLWDKDSVPTWLRHWASREFGAVVAAETAALMNNYTKTVGRRKYELTDINTYNIINYEEADRVLSTWKGMAEVAATIYEGLPDETRRRRKTTFPLCKDVTARTLSPIMSANNLTVITNSLLSTTVCSAVNGITSSTRLTLGTITGNNPCVSGCPVFSTCKPRSGL
jgi:hypothetical protein